MPRVRLLVRNDGASLHPGRQFLDPPHTRQVRVAPVLRLMARAVLQPEPASGRTAPPRVIDALIDTGAWVSVLARDVWEDYEHDGLVERLAHPTEGLNLTSASTGHIGGHSSGYVFGKLWVRVIDPDLTRPRRELPAVPVIAQLLLNPQALLPYPIILGFHLGVLDGRRLRREPVMGHETPVDRADCGRAYGQEWFLESD